MRNLFYLVVLSLLAGCASQKVMYEGKRRAPAEVATVRGFNQGGNYNYAVTQIRVVDGVETNPDNMMPNTVEVLPGKHRFGIGLYTTNQSQATTVEFEAEAGRTYEFRHAVDETAMNHRQLLKLDAYVYDVTSEQRLFTLDQWSPVTNNVWKLPPIIIYY